MPHGPGIEVWTAPEQQDLTRICSEGIEASDDRVSIGYFFVNGLGMLLRRCSDFHFLQASREGDFT